MDQGRKPARWDAARETWELLRHVVLKLGFVLLFAVVGAAVMFLLPLIAPMIALAGWLDQRRKRAVASRTACLRCGEILGAAAVAKGDLIWAAEMQARCDARPGMRYRPRVVRTLHAVCTACGARYRYDEEVRLFHPAPDELPERSEPIVDGIPYCR